MAVKGPGRPFEKGVSKGRPKGSLNRTGKKAAIMVLQALDELGGVEWLKEAGKKQPAVLTNLIARIIPKDINLEHLGSVTIEQYVISELGQREVPPTEGAEKTAPALVEGAQASAEPVPSDTPAPA